MREYVQPARQHYAAQVTENMTVDQMSAVFSKFVATLVDLYKRTQSGGSLKDAVLAEAGDFYDSVLFTALQKNLPPILAGMVNTQTRDLWMSMASGLIDTLVSVFNNTTSTPNNLSPGSWLPTTPNAPVGWHPY